jgi:hypothetical protein
VAYQLQRGFVMTTTTTPEPAPATTVSEPVPPTLRSQLDFVRPVSTARWGAAFAGAFIAAALWLLLYLVGTGIGLTAVDPNHPESVRGAGIGAGVWTIIAPIIALFFGGLVAGRLAPSPSRTVRGMHGALVWAISTLAMVWMILVVVGRLLSGAISITTNVAGAAAGAAGGVIGSVNTSTLESIGIQPDDLLGPVNERLRAQGKPEVTAPQLQAAAKDALSNAVRTGNIDREQLVRSLANNTSLSEADAEDVANQIDRGWQRTKRQAGQLGERAQTSALQAADVTGKAMLWLSLAMFLGLIASVVGALIPGREESRMSRVEGARTSYNPPQVGDQRAPLDR